ncbi:hypothetical protein N665_0411s0036 [Sinapis alba]|nr:hypothetical protein N665_0411s0036 [Sinapis alba]
MADPLKRMCDELGVCKEEALFYLEGFRWDLNAAMEACRSKTLPSSENERAAAEERRRNELIVKFLEIAIGSSTDDARYYLSRSNWSIEHAAASFYDHTEKKSKPMPLSHEGHTAPRSSGNEGSDLIQDVLSKVPQFHNASMDLSTPRLELTQESIKQFCDVASEASSQAASDCLNHCKGNLEEAIIYFYDVYSKARSGIATDEVVKNFSGMAVDQDSSTDSLQQIPEAKPPVASSQVEDGTTTESLPDEIKEELIDSFSSTTGATRQDANVYLEQYNWDLGRALDFFYEHSDSEKETSALNMGLMENRDLPLPSMGLPSQSQFESSYVSIGPTETQRSLEEGGEGDVTVAIPGMASSQVDGKAAEEGSSMETVPDPIANRDRTTVETQTAPSTIMITIRLADTSGPSLELPFRSNQTVRDIRNAIDQRYPENDRGYNLQSIDGVDYMDWNITVHRVSTGGYTTLCQTYP